MTTRIALPRAELCQTPPAALPAPLTNEREQE